MYQIAICDDEIQIVSELQDKIKCEFNKRMISAKYLCLSDSRELMECLQNKHIDVLFLDIDMPYFTGMDIAGFINKNRLNTLIVFVTSHDALVYQTFEYRPFGFIRKSHLDVELEPLISRIAAELEERKEEITVTKGQEIIRISINSIVFVESFGNYLNIRTDKEEIRIRETLTSIENELKHKGFIRCHKGYLVNSRFISKLGKGQLEILVGDSLCDIPIGRSYEKDVRKAIMEQLRS